MGGIRNNMPVNNEAGDLGNAQINPDIGDLVPNEQGQGDGLFYAEYSPSCGSRCKSILIKSGILLMGILMFAVAFLVSDFITTVVVDEYLPQLNASNPILNSYNRNLDVSNYYSLKCSTEKHIHLNRKVRHLNRRLKKLHKSMEKLIEWRDSIVNETGRIKNETLQECSKQFEKFILKIDEALTLYDADKVGMADYALESAGGYIMSIPDTIPFPSRTSYDLMGLVTLDYPSNPRLLIQPGALPGQCFAFKGSQGRIRIRLAHPVNITAITMEHAHRNLVEDMSSAPKDFAVYGLDEGDSKIENMLGMFQYSLDQKPLQTFHVEKTAGGKTCYKLVELHILTNQGNPEYTCVYRFRVHGNKMEVK